VRCPDKSADEEGRLSALAEYALDGDQRLATLNPVVELAANLFRCPAAAVNLIGAESVFLAASEGIGEFDPRRDVSFCAHAINQTGILVVEDAALDERFHDNPLVTAGMIRFYAGVALRSPTGHALGALCVIDSEPHSGFSEVDRERLQQLAALASDRLELRRIDVALRANSGMFAQRSLGSPSAIVSCDDRGAILSCNAAAAELFGQAAQALCGRPFADLIAPEDRAGAAEFMGRALAGGVPLARGLSLCVDRADGTPARVEMHCSHWHEGDSVRLGIIMQGLSGARGALASAADAARDPVTRLPPRDALLAALDEALARRDACGLIVVGLVGLADINSTLGHAVGDRVLQETGRRLERISGGARLVARIASDEFGVLLDQRDPIGLARHGHDIALVLAEPLEIGDQEIRLGSCCGVAMAPDHARQPDELLGNAELALIQARSRGRSSVSLFVPQLRAQAITRRLAEAQLHAAFSQGQFRLVYQPQVNLADGSLVGAEALLRWRHPMRGLQAPSEFLPLLEASSLAADVGNWVLDEACAQAALWRRTRPDVVISVNLFAAQLREGNLPALVAAAIARHGLAPDAVNLEVTENIILDQQDHILAQMDALRAAGIALSFDDFGTGFASLNLLRNFPVSHIKVDKSFVQLAGISEKDRAIIVSLIRMSHELGLKVTAEGIETEAIARWLLDQGCDTGQGYHFGEPCSPGDFVDRYLADGADWRPVAAAEVPRRRIAGGR